MQTIQLTKLKELPIPKSLDEKLLVSIVQDHLQAIIVNVNPSGELFFDTEINPNWTYAHVKVTAAETQFQVGDRVKVNYPGYHNLAVVKGFVDGMITVAYASNYEENVLATELTLITNE